MPCRALPCLASGLIPAIGTPRIKLKTWMGRDGIVGELPVRGGWIDLEGGSLWKESCME